MYALDASSGRLMSQFTTGGPISHSVRLSHDDAYVYAGCQDKKLYCLLAANVAHKVFEFPTKGAVSSTPVVAPSNEMAFFGSEVSACL